MVIECEGLNTPNVEASQGAPARKLEKMNGGFVTEVAGPDIQTRRYMSIGLKRKENRNWIHVSQ